MSFYKTRTEKVLNKYGYYIYEYTYTDRVKNIYIASKQTKRVEQCICGRNWQELSEKVCYELAMFNRF